MKSSITGAILIASVVLTGNAAMAANTPAHKYASGISRARAAVPAAPRLPRGELNTDIGQFIQSMLGGGPVQYSRLMQDASRRQSSHRSAGSMDWSPSYDNSPSVDAGSSASDSQAASDAEAQAIQSMNDTNALNASMAAAEAQNEAAQAAAIQTEINANN
jgi:multidrug resistance efflux pump